MSQLNICTSGPSTSTLEKYAWKNYYNLIFVLVFAITPSKLVAQEGLESGSEKLNAILVMHEANFGAILQWSGTAIVESRSFNQGEVKGGNEVVINFKVDNENDRYFVFSRDIVADGEVAGRWGEIVTENVHRKLHYFRSGNPTVTIQNGHTQASTLTPLAFNPIAAFKWGLDNPKSILRITKQADDKEWAQNSIEDTDQEMRLSWKNVKLDCEPTLFRLSKSAGGNLIECINHSPSTTYWTKMKWIKISEVWLPEEYRYEISDKQHMRYWLHVKFSEQTVNRAFDEEDFSLKNWDLPDKAFIHDQRDGNKGTLNKRVIRSAQFTVMEYTLIVASGIVALYSGNQILRSNRNSRK